MRCSRVGCGGNAVASFCFDGRAALVWLDPLDPDHGVGAGVLCARHADALTPPRGWHLQDRRVPTPRLWDDRPPLPEPVRQPRAVAAVAAAHVDTDVETPPPLPFDETQPEARPTPLATLLDARTPLLARAFAAVRDP
jgi:Protein of unknown function (DUF3499)